MLLDQVPAQVARFLDLGDRFSRSVLSEAASSPCCCGTGPDQGGTERPRDAWRPVRRSARCPAAGPVSASPARLCSASKPPRLVQALASSRRNSGRSGKSWRQPLGLGEFPPIMRLGIGPAAIRLLDHPQAVGRLGQCLAEPGDSGKVGRPAARASCECPAKPSSAGLVSPSSIRS